LVRLAVAPHRAHHLAAHQVDDGNEDHETSAAMTRVWVVEYLSAGGSMAGDAELLAQGTAMRDAMAADLLACADCDVSVAACAHTRDAPPGAQTLLARDGEDPLEFVARAQHGFDAVWVVAPETGGLLLRCAQAVAPPRWLGCTPAAIALATSKRATVERLATQGLLTPLGFTDDPTVRRWVVKPDDGAGAVATRVHADLGSARADQADRAGEGASAWLEPWVDGQALSLSLLCNGHGAELLSVNRQHIEVDADGRLGFHGVALNVLPPADPRRAELASLAAQVVQAVPGLRGFVGIDIVWHARRGPVVIEINPRLTSAYVGLPAALGRPLAAEVLAACGREAAHA